MTVDRRTFIVATASTVLAPSFALLSVQLPAAAIVSDRLILKIDGWSIPDDSDTADVAWIRIDHSWRAAWR